MDLAELARQIYLARKGTLGSPVDLQHGELCRRAGLRIQLAVLNLFLADGDQLAGWKVSFTSGANRDAMGFGYRPFGFILESHDFTTGATVILPADGAVAIEPEICLTIGKRIEGPVTADEARCAVQSVQAAFEINHARLPAAPADGFRLADGTGQWGIVRGEPVDPRDDLNTTMVELFCEDRLVATSSPGLAMDDPFVSLARLATSLSDFGLSVDAGQHVITGAFARASVHGSDHWRATFSELGEVTVRLEL